MGEKKTHLMKWTILKLGTCAQQNIPLREYKKASHWKVGDVCNTYHHQKTFLYAEYRKNEDKSRKKTTDKPTDQQTKDMNKLFTKKGYTHVQWKHVQSHQSWGKSKLK